MLRSLTNLGDNKRQLIADIERRHPWLSVAEADRSAPTGDDSGRKAG